MLAAMAMVVTVSLTSCSDDDFTASIYDPTDYPLDRELYSFPLDTFCKVNFQEPYNLRYLYKMEDVGSDMDYNLVPCAYDKAIDFAVICKYLWFDVYTKVAGKEEFLKKYSPRIIHLIGSSAHNPQSGTEILGTAEGGLKVTLYKGNALNTNDIEDLNEKFFGTMHHEFGHILHQNVIYPTAFNLISNGQYQPQDWQDTPDSVAVSRGFITPYASSATRDDWVEIFSRYITYPKERWEATMNTASFEWEKAEALNSDTISRCQKNGVSMDILGYVTDVTTDTKGEETQYTVQRKVIQRDDAGHPILSDGTVIILAQAEKGDDGKVKDNYGWNTRSLATNEYVDCTGKLVYLHTTGVFGDQVINEKMQLLRTWLKENFNMDLEDLHNEVQKREWLTDADGNFVYRNGKLVNRLTQPSEEDPSRTLIEVLRDEVNKYKSLQK